MVAAPEFSRICPGPFCSLGEFEALGISGPAAGSVGRYMLTSRRLVSSTVLRRGNASSFRSLSVAVSNLPLPGAKGCGTDAAVSEWRFASGKPFMASEVGDAVKGGLCDVLVRYDAIPYDPPSVSRLRFDLTLFTLDNERDCASPGEDLTECNVGTVIGGDPAALRGGCGIRFGSQRPAMQIPLQSGNCADRQYKLTRLVRVNKLIPI